MKFRCPPYVNVCSQFMWSKNFHLCGLKGTLKAWHEKFWQISWWNSYFLEEHWWGSELNNNLCLIKLFIFYESMHTGICLRFNVGLHSEQTFHITVTSWWTPPFHYVRQALLLLCFHILKWLGIQTCFKLLMQLLNFKNHFWSCGIPIICSRKLLTDRHTHTHTHTHLYVPIIELGNKFQLQYMFCYFRCVSFIEEWWWSEVSFSIH